ncbi:MAG: T9SS type A sorting domain-containing protein [Bacteroidetes bacterium]|nr:T9SS type A sorting domain-containing protein [Bacteroidota bacterium]
MKVNLYKAAFLTLVLTAIRPDLNGQNLYVDFKDGQLDSFAINKIRKMAYTGNVLNLQLINKSVYSWDLSILDKLSYERPIGIDELLSFVSDLEFSAYPNPTEDAIQIGFALQESASVVIRLYDASGKLISENPMNNLSPGKYIKWVSIGNVQAGIYQVQLSSGYGIVSTQIVKN